MAPRAKAVRQSDVTRLVKGVVAAGEKVERVEVDAAGGKITIYTTSSAIATPAGALDNWMARRGSR